MKTKRTKSGSRKKISSSMSRSKGTIKLPVVPLILCTLLWLVLLTAAGMGFLFYNMFSSQNHENGSNNHDDVIEVPRNNHHHHFKKNRFHDDTLSVKRQQFSLRQKLQHLKDLKALKKEANNIDNELHPHLHNKPILNWEAPKQIHIDHDSMKDDDTTKVIKNKDDVKKVTFGGANLRQQQQKVVLNKKEEANNNIDDVHNENGGHHDEHHDESKDKGSENDNENDGDDDDDDDKKSDNNNNNNNNNEDTNKAAKAMDNDNKKASLPSGGGGVIVNIDVDKLGNEIESLKKRFNNRYGGPELADHFLKKSVTSYGSIDATADRILIAAAKQRPFVMSFAGSTATVGVGNYYNQSYPFVVQRVLQKAMDTILLPVSSATDDDKTTKKMFIVRNAAMDGIPSFPYGLCLKHFLGMDADVIGWDFSVTDGSRSGSASIFEAYIRQAISQLPKQPMMIMMDSIHNLVPEENYRGHLLHNYTNDIKVIKDAITVVKKPMEGEQIINKKFLEDALIANLGSKDKEFFSGLRHFEVYSAPETCPGITQWNPSYSEHDFVGWMIAMHFVEALEIVKTKIQDNPTEWKKQYQGSENYDDPKPKTVLPQNVLSLLTPGGLHILKSSYKGLLFGHRKNGFKKEYLMNDIACSSNYLPAVDDASILSSATSIVISGLNRETVPSKDDNLYRNIIQKRSHTQYENGWVLDISDKDRLQRIKLENCDPEEKRLGFQDIKLALYGIPQSGILKLFLTHPQTKGSMWKSDIDELDNWGPKYYGAVLICQANNLQRRNKAKKDDENVCELTEHIDFVVGGKPVTITKDDMVDGIGEFKHHKLCIVLSVPQDSKLIRYGDAIGDGSSSHKTNSISDARVMMENNNHHPWSVDDRGLVVEISIKPLDKGETRQKCDISHIIWERRLIEKGE